MHKIGLRQIVMRKFSLVVVMVLALAACGQSFVYNFVPRLVLWEIDNYVSLSNSQSRQVLTALRDVLEVHRNEHIPFYLREINQIEADYRAGSVTPETVAQWYTTINVYRRETLAWFAPIGVDQLRLLDAGQRNELIENLEANLAERREDDGRPDETEQERRERWLESRVNNIEDIVGPLRDDQVQILARSTNEQLETRKYWLDYREAWLKGFDEALTTSDWPTVERLLQEPETFYPAEYQRRLDINRTNAFESISQMLNSMDESQRQGIFDQLDEWRDLLQSIYNQRA